MYFCRSWFSNMVSFIYVLVFLNFLHDIFSIKFYTISLLCKHNFFIDEKHTQWMLDTKVKLFHAAGLHFKKFSILLYIKDENPAEYNYWACAIEKISRSFPNIKTILLSNISR